MVGLFCVAQILQYLHETGLSPERRQVFASYVVQKGISSNDAMRDEIYVQLCSQSMGAQSAANKSIGTPPDSRTEAVWNLMVACLCTFPPTANLAKYLLKLVDLTCNYRLIGR
jgi:MyTH4 domain